MSNITKKVLEELIDFDFPISKARGSDIIVRRIEELYATNLPLDYKLFLVDYGGCIVKDGMGFKPIAPTPVTPSDGFDSIIAFYGIGHELYSIESAIQDHMRVFGNVVMPIADAGGGDLVCIGLNGSYEGKVYYWHHEDETPIVDGVEHYYLIADSFQDFLLRFSHRSESFDVDLDDVTISLDDDLLKD